MTEQEYTLKAAALNAERQKLRQHSSIYLIVKLASFLSAVAAGYFTYQHPNTAHIVCILVSAIIYIAFCVIDDKCMNQIKRLKDMMEVCRKEIEYLQSNYTSFGDGSQYLNPQHEYAFDLDLFGKDSLFNRINRTITQGGSDCLARKLEQLSSNKEEITANGEAIAELALLNNWRIEFMSHPHVDTAIDTLADYAGRHRFRNILFTSILPYIVILLTLAAAVMAIAGTTSWSFFSFMFMVQILITITISKISSKTSMDTGKLHKQYACYLNILNDINQADFQSDKLRSLKEQLFSADANSLQAFRKLSHLLNMFNQRGGVIMYVLLNGVLMFDVLLIRMFIDWTRRYQAHLSLWAASISEMDALVSMGTYAANSPHNHPAEIIETENGNIVEARQMYHPFLHHDKAIANDFTLGRKDISIVTGANMAGKSTFLRTLGITYVMACNGMPVCAESFRFSIVTLFSSMRTSDNLSKDISYFNAELLRLKQLIEHVKHHGYTLIILDEILKGTNSKDKLEGSLMFLKEISQYNVSAIIATHDLELARLEEQDGNTYHNYCFEIELSDDIRYTYKINRGVAKNLNASYLLANILKSLRE